MIALVDGARLTRLCALLALAGACSGGGGGDPGGGEVTGPAACLFANPVGKGQDPWVVRHDGWYYLVESRDNAIYIHRSQKLTEVRSAPGVRVWQPSGGWNRMHIWAPELHLIDGRWYIYYAAGAAGPPFVHQRSGVLQSTTDDPMGSYLDRGMLYTGDDVAAGTENIWSIDLTVARIGDQLYALWSGWPENRTTDRTPQYLYMARMSNPWTISSDRVLISSPAEPWELGSELNLQEGPQFLRRDDQLFIIYSTRESWLREYRLGQLRLRSAGADPMTVGSWIKSGPVFTGTENVYGVGHASFTKSPDGKEDWIVYHTKVSPTPGWDRVIHMQRFTWNPDGSPNFGVPAPLGRSLAVPSGQCP